MEKPRQSKCILKSREGVTKGKESVWKPPKPTPTSHIPIEALQDNAGVKMFKDRGGRIRPSSPAPSRFLQLLGTQEPPQPALPFKPSCCSAPGWVL